MTRRAIAMNGAIKRSHANRPAYSCASITLPASS
jgi:hypothetical protein